MRILVSTRFYRNGQTTHVLSLCTELLRQGHEVFLIISHLDCPAYASLLTEEGIPYSRHGDPLRLLDLLTKWKPDLIHNHSAQTLKASIKLSEALQIPCLSTIHYLDYPHLELLDSQGAVIVISREMRNAFRKKINSPLFLVENGIALPLQVKRKQFSRKALFLAQVSEGKEQNFSQMAKALKTWGWEVFSAGNWRHPLVHNLGWVTNIWPHLEQVDLVVGTGRAIREGMAANCATWVLGDYSDGLVTPKNIRALRQKNFSGRSSKRAFSPLQATPFLQNPDARHLQELGQFGRRYASKHFSVTFMVKKLHKIYRQVLDRYPNQELDRNTKNYVKY